MIHFSNLQIKMMNFIDKSIHEFIPEVPNLLDEVLNKTKERHMCIVLCLTRGSKISSSFSQKRLVETIKLRHFPLSLIFSCLCLSVYFFLSTRNGWRMGSSIHLYHPERTTDGGVGPPIPSVPDGIRGVCVVVYYESIKRELETKPIYECRCDERLKTRVEESTHLAYTHGPIRPRIGPMYKEIIKTNFFT